MKIVPAPHRAVPVHWSLLAAHFEEACFLWGQWERALVSANHDLEDVMDLEERLLAHLDALVLGGGRASTRLLLPALDAEEPETVGCAALALLLQEEEGAESEQRVLDRFVEGAGTQRSGILRALQLAPSSRLEGSLRALLGSAPPAIQGAILEVFGYWNVDPGPQLQQLLLHEEPDVRAAALLAARGAPARLDDKALELGFRSSLPRVREAALEVGLVCARQKAWAECRRWVMAGEPGGGLAMRALAISGGSNSQRLLLDALSTSDARRDVLRALGFLGTVEAVRACLSLMREDAASTRLAGEAFSIITGVGITGRLAKPAEQSGDGESEEPGPEQELSVPDAVQVEAWWAEQGPRFEVGWRYLGGQPFDQGVLLRSLREGSMYRRRGLALELALRTGGQIVLRSDALTRTQFAQLEAARRAPSTLFLRSMTRAYHV